MAAIAVLVTVGCDGDGGVPGTEGPDPIGPASVRLIPFATQYNDGDTVVASILIEEANDVGSVAFHLRYDNDVLRFLPPAIEGPFMSEDGADTVFLASDQGSGGELVVGLSRLGGAGAHGTGVLATFEFEAIGPGLSEFEFVAASVKDPSAQYLPSVFRVVQIQVS
jgi:hypothetical protein